MSTITQFAPTVNAPFQFQAMLSGPTSNVTSIGASFAVTVLWNVSGQRWWVQIADQGGNIVLSRALTASPPGYPINLVGGYFSVSSLVFWEATQTFEVTP